MLILGMAALTVGRALAVTNPPLRAVIQAGGVRNIRMTNNVVRIRIENVSDDPVHIMKPLDGSFWNWHLPFYRLEVIGHDGKVLPNQERLPMSGLWADTKFPEDYEVVLAPGERFEMEKIMPTVVPSAGVYRVRFEYLFDPKLSWRDPWTYPDTMWIGRVRAPDVQAELEETR